MTASVSFYNNWTNELIPAGSGLGFFGSGGFGRSVAVSQYNDTTYLTDSGGTIQGSLASNVKYISPSSGSINSDPTINILYSANYQATCRIVFHSDTPVQVQNVHLRAFDRSNIDNSPSGHIIKAYEVIHTGTSNLIAGSGASTWTSISGSGSYLTLSNSPGISGFYALDGTSSTHSDTDHWFFINLSASPNSIGSKYSALYFECEFL